MTRRDLLKRAGGVLVAGLAAIWVKERAGGGTLSMPGQTAYGGEHASLRIDTDTSRASRGGYFSKIPETT